MEADSPAEKSGLAIGDWIVALHGKPMTRHSHLFEHRSEDKAGAVLGLTVLCPRAGMLVARELSISPAIR